MAKIKFGMFMTDARGKVGGHVFSKNRSGAYVRTKVTPSNARSTRQQAVRSLLSSLSQSWSGLTQAVRDGFDGAVTQWSSTDIFGDIKNPTGKNLFTKLNFNLVNSGQAQITSVPEKLEMPALVVDTLSNDNGVFNVEGIAIPLLGRIVVSATAPQSQGTKFYKGKFRQLGVITPAQWTDGDLTNLYVDKFGLAAASMNIAFEFKLVLPNGQMSTPIVAKPQDL